MMLELLLIIFFCWIFFGVIKLAFKITGGLIAVAGVILGIAALPALIVIVVFAGGLVLLVPVLMAAGAYTILKACVD